MDYREELIYAVAAQIYRDVEMEDYTAIFELLEQLDTGRMESFLNEEVAGDLKQRYFDNNEVDSVGC